MAIKATRNKIICFLSADWEDYRYPVLRLVNNIMSNLFKNHQYQVVLEFHGDDPENVKRVLALETKLEEALKTGEVDGNDVGQEAVNIFMITKEPQRCFEEAMCVLNDADSAPDAAGYRDIEEEDYIRLWPKGDITPFELK